MYWLDERRWSFSGNSSDKRRMLHNINVIFESRFVMNNSEKAYIEDLKKHTEESITFFSNSMKSERERSVCAAFLRCIGVNFEVKEIVAKKNDPPDVIFDGANFEIRELYEVGRKRHDEYRDRLKELKQAKTINDTLFSIELPKPITYEFLFAGLESALSSKAKKYGAEKCFSLDALVYVAFPQKFLDIKSKIPNPNKIEGQGWRSVSFIIPPFGHVVSCREDAPKFLRKFEGKTYMEWKEPDGLFEI